MVVRAVILLVVQHDELHRDGDKPAVMDRTDLKSGTDIETITVTEMNLL